MTARFVFTSSTAYLAVTAAEVAATFVSLPIMTRMLSPAEYGLMLLIANTAGLVNLMFGFSLAQALPTLFAGTMSLERRRAVSTTNSCDYRGRLDGSLRDDGDLRRRDFASTVADRRSR